MLRVLRPTRLALLIAATAWLSIILLKSPWRELNVINSDAYGYNMYLVGATSPHGMRSARTFHEIEHTYQLDGLKGYARHTLENGNVVFKYTMGMAIMNAPLFGAAHVYALWTGGAADGFAMPYQVATALSTWWWALCALFVTGRVLRLWFTESVVAVVLLLIAFGTNAFYYSALTYGMSHMPSMFLFSSTLLVSLAWLERPRALHAALVGAGLGMIGLVRPTDLIFILIPAAVLFRHLATNPAGARRYRHVILAGVVSLIVLVPQGVYWKLTTGQWVYQSYVGEALNFGSPHVLDGLFSFQKGWLLYTPVMVLGVLGLLLFRTRAAWLTAAVAVFTAVHVFVVFSWPEWWYGGGFGARPMIQSYALLSLPLASCVESYVLLLTRHGGLVRRIKVVVSGSLMAGAVALNLFQTAQLDRGVIHSTNMSRNAYWQTFGVWSLDEVEYQRIHPESERLLLETKLQRDLASTPSTATTVIAASLIIALALALLAGLIIERPRYGGYR